METIRKTVESKYAPKQTNVIWVDTSGDTPVEKHFIKGKWREMSGGSAGSSNPTEADANKVWQVTPVQKDTKTEETAIVPEQTLIDGQELEYNDKFVPGAQCIAVIDGVEYRGEVIGDEPVYTFSEEGICTFQYDTEDEIFKFWNEKDSPEVTAKLSIIEETSIYDYNWAPGVKIPIPTAEDEGKILVVTKVEGSNTSIIVPEQPVPVDNNIPLTNVDLTKFVAGNIVKITVSENSQTFTATGVIEKDGPVNYSDFDIGGRVFYVAQINNLLYTNVVDRFDNNSTIKLEYIESNYEYQLQENGGGSSGSSNILYCEGSNDGYGLITAYIDSSELDNPQITTIAVHISGENDYDYYFYRMMSRGWLVSGFNTFNDSSEWIKEWNTVGQYPTIKAYFTNK